MYERVLVPTDGSDTAAHAVDYAVDLAAQYDADLHALYVVDIDAVSFGLGSEQVDRIRQGRFGEMSELRERAESAIDRVTDPAAERGVETVDEIRVGVPHKVITDYAEETDVDVIVMGSHGRSGIKRALLGSVTERVLRLTHRPVLVIDARSEA